MEGCGKSDRENIFNSVLKSLIFQAFVMISKMGSNDHTTAMVYTPLNSLTHSLIKLSAVELKSADFQLLFGSAESVLDESHEFHARVPSFFVSSCTFCR